MCPWYGGIGLWEPPQKWFRRHKQSKVYAVRVGVDPAAALDSAWEALTAKHRTENGFVLDGGASLERKGGDEVEVVSGGEDGLESLAWSVNVTLGEAVRAADPEAQLRVISQRQVMRS